MHQDKRLLLRIHDQNLTTRTYLQDGSGSERDELKTLCFGHLGRETHEVVEEEFGRLCLPCAALSADDDRLVLSVTQH